MRTLSSLPRILIALLGTALLILTASTAASASTSAKTTLTGAAHSSTLHPLTDGGCSTDSNGQAQLCLHFIGGGNTNEASMSVKNLGSGTLNNVHIQLLGPSHQPANSITWNVPAGQTRNYYICETACYWSSGTYEAILWQYYNNQYNNIAQYYAPVS